MKEKTYKIYVAFDGTEFVNKEKCIEHEKQEMINRAKAVHDLCLKIDCKDCPFYVPYKENPYYCKFSGQTLFEIFDN